MDNVVKIGFTRKPHVLIPLNVAFVIKHDDELKTIFMDLPKGQLDL